MERNSVMLAAHQLALTTSSYTVFEITWLIVCVIYVPIASRDANVQDIVQTQDTLCPIELTS